MERDRLVSVTKPAQLRLGVVYFMPITALFVIVGMTISIVEMAVHANDPSQTFFLQNGFFLLLASSFLLLLVRGRVQLADEATLGGWLRIAMMVGISTAAMLGIQIIIGFFIPRETYQINDLERYLFYINAAVSEEVYFRLFLVNASIACLSFKNKVAGIVTIMIITSGAIAIGFIIDVTTRIIVVGSTMMVFPVADGFFHGRAKSAPSPLVAYFVAATVSGPTFGLAHWAVYHDVPLMMLSTALAGTVMAIMLVYSKDPLTCFVPHVTNNAIAAGVIVTNSILKVIA